MTLAPLKGLDFREFIHARLALLADHPHMVDAADTQLYRTLPQIDPVAFSPIAASINPKAAHRCHLAEAWCEYLGLAEAIWKPRMLVSQGVRDSLGIMMRQAARERSTLWVPSDVYPVYLELAEQSGGSLQAYPARRGVDLDALALAKRWTLLVCDPLKPWGGAIDPQQREQLVELAKRNDGNILVDGAYALGFSNGWREHIERDDPVALLLSASKGWLLPYKGGTTIAGDQFSKRWKTAFATARPNVEGLREAFAALIDYSDRPSQVQAVVDRSRRDMLAEIRSRGIALQDPGHGYLVACEHDPDGLVEQGVLAVPASVFGSNMGGCVLSSIGWARPVG